ncbi:3-hexulose-6-phosphate synthase [uncultured Propionibacterium sp.]|uniref:3-hexulose-6-phosphate synthase n=1 Tax=uncultured Propionibacterium sp. TaxID=218066 RepID=UPI0029318FB4|nr:3-hexulose-6-phosphate synthase [uncultured Propionibacterium sp.]
MKLQIALDELTLDQAVGLVSRVREHIDIIEVGTPFIIAEGVHAVRALRRAFPEKKILADTKIMDAGEYEARLAFDAGADYVTVLAVTDGRTVRACLGAAEEAGGAVVADMICVEDNARKVAALEAMGVRHIAVHTGVDAQAAGRTPLDDLREIRALTSGSEIFVAGGISSDTLPRYIDAGADVVIVGGGIAHAPSPADEARLLAGALHEGGAAR